ncbi:DNA-directed RNA polymerase subunit omega [Candidatus Saganbacteria bacterium]|nr:DNA-directed RNA polymerase subunit omega [Candidatus Saganbacteria bacterium]
MNELNIDNLLTKAKNKFLLTNAAASRARQLVDGSLPYINNFDPNNPVITALRELAADKIKIKILSGPSQKPQELLVHEEEAPSATTRLAKEKKSKPAGAVKAKKEKK